MHVDAVTWHVGMLQELKHHGNIEMGVRRGYVGERQREAVVTQSQEAVRGSLIPHDSGGLHISVLLDNTPPGASLGKYTTPPPTSRSRRPPLTPNRGDGEKK